MRFVVLDALFALGQVTFRISFLGEVGRMAIVLHCSRSCAGDRPMSGFGVFL